MKTLIRPTLRQTLASWLPPDWSPAHKREYLYDELALPNSHRQLLKRLRENEEGIAPFPAGQTRIWKNLWEEWPYFASTTSAVATTPVGVTPTGLGATTARIFPFYLDAGLTIAKIYISTPNAVSGSFQMGIYDALGASIWSAGGQATTANITVITLGTSVKVYMGSTYYLGITNNNAVSATTAYWFTPAFSAATLGRWGTVSATLGAIPASIAPGSITATVGGFPCLTVLSNI